jgi:hypothetical protein
MQGISITGPGPRPDVVARIGADHERLEQRARRHAERIETRAATRPCRTCGYCCLNDTGTSCCYCGTDQGRSGSPMRVEHHAAKASPGARRTTPSTPAAQHVRAYYGPVEHSQHIGHIIDVR